MSDPLSSAPPDVASAIQTLRDSLVKSAGTNVAALILYGGLARGRFRPGQSDVNVVVVLNSAAAADLDAIGPPLRAAWRRARVEPLIITMAEIADSADAFPTKFLDIKDHHVVLAGTNPFAEISVDREQVRIRIEQELRNMLLRLRRRYVAVADDADAQCKLLAQIVRPLAIELESLLRLSGNQVPAEDRSAEVFAVAAVAFDLDAGALARLAALRTDRAAAENGAELYDAALSILARVISVADKLEVAP